MEAVKIPEIMFLVADYLLSVGVSKLADTHSGRVFKRVIDDHWAVTINPNNITIDEIPAWSMMFEFNGCPAGIVNSIGGWFAAGTLANEETLSEALRKATIQPSPISVSDHADGRL